MMYRPDPKNTLMLTAVVLPSSIMRHSQNWTADFSKILTGGVKSIRQQPQSKLVTPL